MPRIQPLPAGVVTKIAAGEVIERPASALKELLENAVDAGTTRIDVEVSQGGLGAIRVVDDGCGIEPDDLPLAFARHATSKLRDAEGLFRIGTLGFRGEGLASVGGVAQVRLQSRPPGAASGAEVACHGGALSPVRVWNGAPGTRVEVRHLFFNTPARRKFLRGPAAEMGHVAEAFTRIALSQLSRHLTLRHNGKVVYDVPASAGLLDRVGIFFGADVRDRLLMVEAEQGGATLAGYVADPGVERGSGGAQFWFVNGRWVRDRGLAQALHEAYRGLLMTGRHAVSFLFLDVPPERVDVNVHPTKAEVRFRDAPALHRFIESAVRQRLRAADLTALLRAPTPPEADPPAAAPARTSEPSTPAPAPAAAPAPPTAPRRRAPSHAAATRAAEGLRAVQLHDLYLVVEVPEGMLVIDQHALHERILFEQYRERVRAGSLDVQRLLIPEPVELTPREAALVQEHRAALAGLGLDVSDFGGGTVLLRSYPALAGRRPPAALLRAVVDYLAGREQPPTREALLNDLLSLMACHSAVRAGDRLTAEEIAALVAQRERAADSHHCPHGRPASLLFTKQNLERQFRR
jgi:DNA mismatch repair protein MutL